MKALILIIPCACALLLPACAPKQMLVFLDSPTWEAMGGGPVLEKGLSALAERHGMSLRLTLAAVAVPARERLNKELARPGTAAAVIGPFFTADAAPAAAARPGVKLILLAGSGSGGVPPNTVVLRFDRAQAFETAGYAVSLSLRQEGKGKAGILVSSWRTPGGEEEIAAFQRGLAAGGATPVVRELAEPIDRNAVAQAVSEMAREGVEVLLPRLGWQNLACLESLKAARGCAVTEDWQASGTMPDQVFLSIEEDTLAGIEAGLSGAPGSTVAGSVWVACGKARRVPAEMEGRIRCR